MALSFRTNKEVKKKDDRYYRLKNGENKFRIVDPESAIEGWEVWNNKQPTRYRDDEEKPQEAKGFFGLHIWDYLDKRLKVFVVNQVGIKKYIENFASIGDLDTFDIVINRTETGSRMDEKTGEMVPNIKYDVRTEKRSPMPKEAIYALSNISVRLEALYEGKDPWNDLDGPKSKPVVSDDIFLDPIVELKQRLSFDGLDDCLLNTFIKDIAEGRGRSFDDIAKDAIDPDRYPKFKDLYYNFLDKNSA